MNQYKIVASDLDGTFLSRTGCVSEENWRAVEELERRDVLFVPCTGRTLLEINADIRENPAVRYIIHSDGAVVYDKRSGERISACMSSEEATRILNLLEHYPTILSVRCNGQVHMDAEDDREEVYERFHINRYIRHEVMSRAVRMEGFDAFCRAQDEMEMMSAFFETEEDRESFLEELVATNAYAYIRWEGLLYCEVFSLRAGKGNALRALAEHLGLDPEQTIGVGDSTNDMTLIGAAGLGLAVSNACPQLKEAADAVICSNEEHAIQYIAEHFIKSLC